MWSSKQIDLGLILTYVTSVNDPTSLNLNPSSFSKRGNRVLTNCCGHWVNDSERTFSVSNKILPTLALGHLIHTFPPLSQHLPCSFLPNPIFQLHWRVCNYLKMPCLFSVLNLPGILSILSQYGKVFSLSSNVNGSVGICKIFPYCSPSVAPLQLW